MNNSLIPVGLCVSALFVSVAFTIPESNWDQPLPLRELTLEQALIEGLVTADFNSTGGHKGYCAEATLTNQTDRPLRVMIEPGRRLVSDNSEAQDILITREAPVILASAENKMVPVYGFCSQLDNDSPETGSSFSAGRIVSGDTLELANFLARKKFPYVSEQQAVWTITDDNSLVSIHHSDRDSITDLLHFVARMKKQPVPQYSMEYAEDDDRLLTDQPTVLHPRFVWMEDHGSNVHVVVYDNFGRSIKRAWIRVPDNSAGQQFSTAIPVDDLPEGRYFVKAYDSSINLIEEMDVRI